MSNDFVFFNNKLIPRSEAKVSIDDSGFLYGFGCYETILALNWRPLFLEEHLKRLNDSLKSLRISSKAISSKIVKDNLLKLLKINNYKNARIRITITKGELSFNHIYVETPICTQLITSAKLLDDFILQKAKPQKLMVSNYIRNHPESIPASLKLTSLANHLFANIEAKESGFDDAIMLNHKGYITEGTSFNIFFIKKGIIHTPHLKTGILPGITRKVIINLLKESKLTCKEGYYILDKLYEADEIFISSSIRGIVPVTQIDHSFKKEHEITNKITKLYNEHLKVVSEHEL